jgi:hypothetical protein
VVSRIKKSENSGVKLNKNIFLISGFAVLLTLVVILCVVLIKVNSESKNNSQNNISTSIVYKEGLTFAPTKENENNREDETGQIITENRDNNADSPVINNQNSQENILPDSSNWTTSQIIAKAKDAVNKTKAYTGNLTVAHSEGFTADVTECSAGGIVRSVVDLMIGWVVKPVDETLVYQNGRAINSEGENVPIILPKRNDFTLTESGVESASVKRSGNEYVINIKLVEESVGMHQVPQHNAAAVGYLDVANFDLSFMEIDSADITYKGSSITLHINANGYVTYASYKVPLKINGSAHKGSVSGSATFVGEQTELWTLNY